MSAPSVKGGTLPWCPSCECFAVPTDEGNCGDCGSSVIITDGGEVTASTDADDEKMRAHVLAAAGADTDDCIDAMWWCRNCDHWVGRCLSACSCGRDRPHAPLTTDDVEDPDRYHLRSTETQTRLRRLAIRAQKLVGGRSQ